MLTFTHIESEPFQQLEVEPGVWFYMNHFKQHQEHAAHFHNYLELAFILSGTARHMTVVGESWLSAGAVIVVPRGSWHAYSDCQDLEIVNCLFSPQMLGRELAWLVNDEELGALFGLRQAGGLQEVVKIDLVETHLTQLRAQLLRLKEAYEQGRHRTLLVCYLLEGLELLRDPIALQWQTLTEGDACSPVVARAIELFHRSLDVDWTLEDLAVQLKLNPSYLIRLFRNQIGMPPMKYLARERAKRAANLLLSTSLRIGEIGINVGWSDPKVFARNFRQHYGMRASDYRKQMLGVVKL
ncbi:AraC family transcriptional regulator [Coraliomargarita sp. W4R72]